jgi:hypothetical protein
MRHPVIAATVAASGWFESLDAYVIPIGIAFIVFGALIAKFWRIPKGLGRRGGEEGFGALAGTMVDRVDILSAQFAAVIRHRSGVGKAHVRKGTKPHVPFAPLHGVAKDPTLGACRADLQIEASAIGQEARYPPPSAMRSEQPYPTISQLPHRLSPL